MSIWDVFFESIGYFAGVCLAISFVPQAFKTIKTKEVSGFSLASYSLYNLSIACWVAYGAYLKSFQMVFFNAMCLMFTMSILFMIIRYKK